MTFLSFVYNLIIGPIVLIFETIFATFYTSTYRVGASIVALSVAVNLLVLPLYRRADAMQEEERCRLEKLKPGVDHIKKVFKGDERFMMLQTYYRYLSWYPICPAPSPLRSRCREATPACRPRNARDTRVGRCCPF